MSWKKDMVENQQVITNITINSDQNMIGTFSSMIADQHGEIKWQRTNF
jgi:hypothetical protein